MWLNEQRQNFNGNFDITDVSLNDVQFIRSIGDGSFSTVSICFQIFILKRKQTNLGLQGKRRETEFDHSYEGSRFLVSLFRIY